MGHLATETSTLVKFGYAFLERYLGDSGYSETCHSGVQVLLIDEDGVFPVKVPLCQGLSCTRGYEKHTQYWSSRVHPARGEGILATIERDLEIGVPVEKPTSAYEGPSCDGDSWNVAGDFEFESVGSMKEFKNIYQDEEDLDVPDWAGGVLE